MTLTPGTGAGIEVLREGIGDYHPVDPDGFREYVRDHKSRALVPKVMTAREAVTRFIADGDYLTYECNYLMRGPNAVVNELIRQQKRDIWLAGKFTYPDVALLVTAGCVTKVDCGFFLATPAVTNALKAGKLQIFEYSNVVMSLRLQAGAMGVPFLPVRSFGGTSGFDHSGAKLIRDPYTGQPITIIPALNPDVALIHVHQADAYGNARIFGTGVADVEAAMASKKVIITAEEIISTDEIRSKPGLTSIPYYAVDAVVEAPFGAYPGSCPGYYGSDPPVVMEMFVAAASNALDRFIAKWIEPFESHTEMLEQRVGLKTLLAMRSREPKEGYQP
jgi:acyl CoA:acetate/3-ketoacid CoA transferase alpha subunit